MTVLILQPDPISPATRISHWLDEAERMYDVINLPALVDRNQHNDEDGPISTKQLDSISGIVICGGRMNCYSEDENPWIPPVMKLLKRKVPPKPKTSSTTPTSTSTSTATATGSDATFTVSVPSHAEL